MVKVVSVKKWKLECRKCGCTFSCTSKDGKQHKFGRGGKNMLQSLYLAFNAHFAEL